MGIALGSGLGAGLGVGRESCGRLVPLRESLAEARYEEEEEAQVLLYKVVDGDVRVGRPEALAAAHPVEGEELPCMD